MREFFDKGSDVGVREDEFVSIWEWLWGDRRGMRVSVWGNLEEICDLVV
jgi:hypothetical protein